MKSLLYALFSAMLILIALPSCIPDDISHSSSDRLAFSRDTVSFDTVFTDLGTPTARLQVFNRNKKGLNISSIKFRNPDSPFSVNVDGVSGTEFKDVEIRANDSIFIFIECFIPETQDKKPRLVEDQLVFVTNGVEQSVTVEAWGRNVIRLRNLTVTDRMTLTAETPYVIFDSLRVAPGATLKIEPGAQLLFHDKASLTVDGTLDARGKPGNLIDMRGDRLDNVLPDVGYDILAGQWRGIRIRESSFDNHMEYVDMRSTEHGLVVDSCAFSPDRVKLTLLNSWLHNSQASALQSKYARVDAYGCIFSEAADAVVSLTGGQHSFIQCTISNYYLYSAISAPLLSLFHCLPDDVIENDYPLMTANFDNCIIYGMADCINTPDLEGSNVFLRYVLMKSEGSDDANFQHCLWDADPLFYTVREDYIFDYRLKPDSPAIGAGNPEFVRAPWNIDIDGLNRLADGNPALGAYVFVAPKEDTEK